MDCKVHHMRDRPAISILGTTALLLSIAGTSVLAAQSMPGACKNAELRRVFRRDDVVCFANDHLAGKGIRCGGSWRIVRTDAKGDCLANIGLLPAHLVKETTHPITGGKVKSKPVTVALNDFIRALEPPAATNELPHPPLAQPQSPGAAEVERPVGTNDRGAQPAEG